MFGWVEVNRSLGESPKANLATIQKVWPQLHSKQEHQCNFLIHMRLNGGVRAGLWCPAALKLGVSEFIKTAVGFLADVTQSPLRTS